MYLAHVYIQICLGELGIFSSPCIWLMYIQICLGELGIFSSPCIWLMYYSDLFG